MSLLQRLRGHRRRDGRALAARRKFIPSALALEGRSLLSTGYGSTGVYNPATGDYATIYGFGVANGSTTGLHGSAVGVVGGSFSLMMGENGLGRVKEVDWTANGVVPGTRSTFFNSNVGIASDTNDSGSSTILMPGSAFSVPYYWNATPGDHHVDVTFKLADGRPDDHFSFDVFITAPVGSINPSFPPASGPGAFQFGVFDAGTTDSDGNLVNTKNIPIPWNQVAATLQNAPANEVYKLALMSPGATPIQFTAVGNNDTPIDGTWSLVQVATSSDASVSAHDNQLQQTIDRTYHSPTGVNGDLQYGLDNGPSGGSFPYAWSGTTVAAPANSGPLPIPTPGVGPQDFGYDNPGYSVQVSAGSPVVTHLDVHIDFATWLVFTPTNGIPVGISSVKWSIDGTEDNPTLRADPYNTDPFDPNLWIGPTPTLTPGTPDNNDPSLIQWSYNFPSSLNLWKKTTITPD